MLQSRFRPHNNRWFLTSRRLNGTSMVNTKSILRCSTGTGHDLLRCLVSLSKLANGYKPPTCASEVPTMSLPAQATILIAGAGPSGMAAAISLHRQGIHDIVIVDSVRAGENSSRAMIIQPATLEALDTIGCLEKLMALGEKAERISIHDGSSYVLSADFALLSSYTKFPFGLLLPQSSTEAVMLKTLDQLGIKVLRPFKVVSLASSQNKDHHIDVRFESGEIVQAKYVIGADGAHSVVLRSMTQTATKSTSTATSPRWPWAM
ncbi:hypothetical protein B0H17DRAFT_397429 [Mycena rosella]|uniref:FAD-binding domain-containing protein n=1 Tax=Mycena rosella TaxID=1033263 RepID=A0AAD7CMC3_MYCRO|nr:hypothetical protein B0H17DRAFT_397429 [Mycena rosella]